MPKEKLAKGVRKGANGEEDLQVYASWRPQAGRSAISCMTCKKDGKEMKLSSISDVMAGSKMAGNQVITQVMTQMRLV